MHFAVIALFPSLSFIFPANVSHLASVMYKSGYTPSAKCDREISISTECVDEIMLRHNISNTSIYNLSNEKLDKYHYEIATTQCLKHSDCTEVEYIRDFYYDATYIVSDVYKRAYGCLEEEASNILSNFNKCLKDHPQAIDREFLEKCSRPVIETFKCDSEQMKAINKFLNETIKLSEDYSIPNYFSTNVANQGDIIQFFLSLSILLVLYI
ncbi:hypothetical protein CRE_05950 [Caenorhabditis remanei]|uniref:DUF19 domain-containing protein n=1 Tax=Caenorhabditis remanei TaxID=31234 RepID=E3MZF8_CAERE|nr:hypothetical protein CRE_05950 [Caenorhabditis remanei]